MKCNIEQQQAETTCDIVQIQGLTQASTTPDKHVKAVQ